MPESALHRNATGLRSSPTSNTTSADIADALIARQPILDIEKRLHSYELLCRDSATVLGARGDPSQMTRLTIHNALHVVGFDTLVGDAKAYVKVTLNNLRGQDHLVLPPERTVLELNGCDKSETDLMELCRDAIKAGFALCINNYSKGCCSKQLVDLVDLVKIDIRSACPAICGALVKDLRSHEVAAVAAKVETQDEFRIAESLGFEFVQGFFFCEPEVLSRRTVVGNQMICLQLLAELNKPDLNLHRVEEVIKSDIALSCGLLRYLNSAALGLSHRIESIRQAMHMLGERPLRKWGSMASISALGQNKPHQLLLTGLVRAHFCEHLAEVLGLKSQALNMYLVGLLSTLDAILDMPMEQALASMPLSDSILEALAGGEGTEPLCVALPLAMASERGAWATVSELCVRAHLTQRDIAQLYYSALRTVNKLFT